MVDGQAGPCMASVHGILAGSAGACMVHGMLVMLDGVVWGVESNVFIVIMVVAYKHAKT